MRAWLALALASACIGMGAGCATESRQQVEAEADRAGYGMAPVDGWQEKIKAFMEMRLKDSGSAIYKFGTPEKSWITKAPIAGGGLDACGYMVSVQINAKNSYGGYTGFEEHRFLLRDGEVIRYAEKAGDFWMWEG